MNFPIPARKWLIAGIVAAGFQTAAVAAMVRDRIQLLAHGHEIVLPVVPVDPRSLFRGDYVILSYDAQRVPLSLIGEDLYQARPQQFYVTLGKVGDTWKPVAVSRKPVSVGADQVILKAKTLYGYWPARPVARPVRPTPPASVGATPSAPPAPPPPVIEPTMQVRYGIEAYFVQEGKGRGLEKTARERKLSAVIAVGPNGEAAIKGLMIDGKLAYEEPLL